MDTHTRPCFIDSLRDPATFTLTFELVPGRGGKTREINRILALARQLAADERFVALSITENAGGHPALSPEVMGKEILAMGTEVIIHFSCKDKNRNQMESLLFSWDRQGLHNLLVIAGDYPKEGYRGFPKPVFDLDTVQALDMLSFLNCGQEGAAATAAETRQPCSFVKGVAISPFKLLESELMMQYYKLHRKVAAGADFAITQVGFDARKFHELLLYVEQNRLDIPLLGNVFVLTLPVAELMYQGRIPGCVIPQSLYEQLQWEARTPDKGREARLVRAARLLAVLKGMGYGGAHIGGPGLTYEDLDFIVRQARVLAPDWQELVRELSFWPGHAFYYYQLDPHTGLNRSEPGIPAASRPGGGLHFTLARRFHDLAFVPQGALYGVMKRGCLALAQGRFRSGLTRFEHLGKAILFGCRNCGDCVLAELAFLCPQAGCAKYLLNGPCGGSRDGWCEVYPGKKRCLYVLVYERLKSLGREEEMRTGFIPPRNWALNNTSSWANFFLGLDHTAARAQGAGMKKK